MSSSTSVGTGTPQDDNENVPTPADHWPSRTMGADAPAARPEGPTPSEDVAPLQTGPDGGAPDVPGEVTEQQAPSFTPEADPDKISQAFPEGPNVAPSPWEDEAARGRS